MEYLDNLGEKVLGNVDIDNIKRQASFYFRDKIKSARLFLTDVTNSQLLAEEATNDDEWGPATKTMAAISDACRRPDESPRIMQVLHARLALIGKKHWRQFLKTLTVVEFLLFHGPEQVVMEFSSDRDLIEDLSRFNYVSERGVDHGMVVRKKAKQVLKLLMEDDYLKEERARAQKLTKSIFGQGSYQSNSTGLGASRYGGFGTTTSTSSASTGLMFDDDADGYHSDKKFNAFEERILSEKRGNRQEKSKSFNGASRDSEWRAFEDDTPGTFSPKQAQQNATGSSWADFSNASADSRNSKFDGSDSPLSRSNELLEEESFSPRSSQLQAASSASSSPSFGKSSSVTTSKVPVLKAVQPEEPKTRGKGKLKARSYALSPLTSGDFKLPPPPPPPGGSKVTIVKSMQQQSSAAQPDLLDMSFDASDSHVREGESLLNMEIPSSKAVGSSSDFMDLLGMASLTTSQTPGSESDLLKNSLNVSSGIRSTPDPFDLVSNSSTQNNSSVDLFGSLGHHQVEANATGGVVKVEAAGSEGGMIPDFLNLNNNNKSSAAEPVEIDFFGTSATVQAPPATAVGVNGSSGLEHEQIFFSERSSTGGASSGLPEVVPDVFDAIAPDFASFGIRGDTEKSKSKPVVASPKLADADDFFNLLS